MGRQTKEQNKSLSDAEIKLKNLDLQFSKPIIDQHFYIPAEVRLCQEPEPSILWIENSPSDWIKGTKEGVQSKPPVTDECLLRFCRLRNATDTDILEFAKLWGILGICPTTTSVSREIPGLSGGHWLCSSYLEPTEVWRDVANRAWGILLVAAELIENKKAFLEDWERVVDFRCWYFRKGGSWQRRTGNSVASVDSSKDGRLKWGIDEQRELLAECVSEWLDQIYVRPTFRWQADKRGILHPILGFDASCVILGGEYGLQPIIHQSELQKKIADRLGNPEFQFDVRDPAHYQRYKLRSSSLFNVIVLQTIAAVMSPLYRCAICSNVFDVEDRRGRGRAKGRHICPSDACKAQAHLDNVNASTRRKSAMKQSGITEQK